MITDIKEISILQEFMNENSEILSHLYSGAKIFEIRKSYYTPKTIINAHVVLGVSKPILTLDVMDDVCIKNSLPTEIGDEEHKYLKIGECKESVPIYRIAFSEKEAVEMCRENCKTILKAYESDSHFVTLRLEALTKRLEEIKHE